jgi:hypothetical protein
MDYLCHVLFQELICADEYAPLQVKCGEVIVSLLQFHITPTFELWGNPNSAAHYTIGNRPEALFDAV